MIGRFLTAAVLSVASCASLQEAVAADQAAGPQPQYLVLGAPAGMSQAVVIQGAPLVHTRQLFPVDRDGNLVGEGSVDKQVEQVLANLDAVLSATGSGLNKLVRLNVYAIAQPTVERLREVLGKRLAPSVRPAITSVLTPLPRRKALLAVDAVAVGAEKGQSVALQRCEAVAGDKECADAAVLPRGGVAYLSGRPDEGGLTLSAVTKSMTGLLKTLEQLKLAPASVVQLKVFLRPATAADDVMHELKKFFPGQALPPVVYVEWVAPVPVEIELIASLPLAGSPAGSPAQTVEFYNPPDTVPSPVFSRVALVRTERQIYISSLFAREAGNGEAQCRDVFEQLKEILTNTGSDMTHLAKAMYYVSDDDGGRGYDRVRPKLLDPRRPPAASKVTVYAIGPAGRTLSLDMIAVGVK